MMSAIFIAIAALAQPAPRIVDVRPSTISTLGGATVLQYEGLTNPLEATIDLKVAYIQPDSANTIVVVCPPHAAGAVELKLKGAGGAEATATLHYGANTDWEGLLLPVRATNVAGAFGSVWNSESLVFNQSSDPVDLGPYGYFPHVAPRSVYAFPANSNSRPEIIWIPTWALPSLSVNSRVQDVSRQAQTWGTELPVPRVSQFSKSVTLLNVPTDARFRDMLRVYFVGSGTFPFHVVGRPMDRDEILFDAQFTAFAPNLDPSAPMSDLVASTAIALETLPNFQSAERLRLTITSDSPGWAFVSVTNDETQHVTLVTPQPR